jgi:hypothetical protein
MWCTECHAAFNWRTGELETGHFHNPHYFEYQRRMGADTRNIMDRPCGALNPDEYHGTISHLIDRVFSFNAKNIRESNGLPEMSDKDQREISRRCIDAAMSISVFSSILPAYRNDAIQNHVELRVKYLTEEINEEQFRNYLFRDAKKFKKEREFGQIVQTLVFAMTDILNRLVLYYRTKLNALRYDESRMKEASVDVNEINAILSEIDRLIDYANECFEKICIVYKVTRVAAFLRKRDEYTAGLATVNVKKTESGTEILTPKTYIARVYY